MPAQAPTSSPSASAAAHKRWVTEFTRSFQTVLFRQLLGFDLKTSLILTAASGSEYFLSAILAIFVRHGPPLCSCRA